MSHRIALIGTEPLRLKALEAELKLEGALVSVASSAEDAAPLARHIVPTALVALVPVDEPAGAQLIAQLLVHPATSSTPVVVVTPGLEPKSAVRAFRSGVVDIVVGTPHGKQLLESISRVLGPTDDDPRRRAAVDRRGPTVLRRIGDFLRTHAASGVLAIRTDEQDAHILLEAGHIKNASVGGHQGGEAIRALLAHPTRAGWDFLLVDELPEDEPGEIIDLDDMDLEIDVEIDLEGLDDLPSSPGMPAMQTAPNPSLRVLLADDDTDLLGLYTAFMQREGWTVETAENGRRGYDMAVDHRPDVIVSDIMMPDTDGWGFLTSVRDDFRLREIPFVLLSCHGDYLHNLEHLDAGANDYLEKGLRGDEVIRRVNAAVAKRRVLAGAADPEVAMSGQLEEVGGRLLLTLLSERGATGIIEVQSGWTQVTVKLCAGRVVEATANHGEHTDRGEAALKTYLALDAGSYTFLPGAVPEKDGSVFFPEIADGLAVAMNRQREQDREHLLADDDPLLLHEKRLAFYETVCADPIRPITELLRKGAKPRSVMAESGASPVLVEWVIKDLLRKGIARFGG